MDCCLRSCMQMIVLMAESTEKLQLKFDGWKTMMEKKGLKAYMGKTTVIGERGR